MAEQDTLLEFPCQFPIKIMGETQDNFVATIVEVVQRHAPGFTEADMEIRNSSAGKYLSMTCNITATSKGQLDNLYLELTGHPMVKVVL